MKRFASIILTLAMILSLICVAGTVTTGAASAPKVSMYSSNVYFSKYGGSTYEVYIQTKNTAKDAQVYAHYNYLDYMGWQDAEAEFVTTMSDGSKIWRVCFSSWNTKYCIKLVNNGKTYWDNNNGKDYDGTEKIGAATITSKRLGYQYTGWGSGFQIDAVLKNLAYHKNVFVRYTTDGWKSHHDSAMSYSMTNADGTETWTTKIDADVNGYDNGIGENFEYAICYRVNGKEYWANNFGSNYDRFFYINH